MLINGLLLISIILISISYLRIILTYFKTKKINITNINGFDLAKELTSNYDEINIVESKEINISKFNLKRRIIKLTNKDYNSNNIFDLSKVTFLSGYSLLTLNKDKNILVLSKILSSIDYLNKSSLLALLISILTRTAGDAKIAIILLLIIILIYQYLINEINIASKDETIKPLKKLLTKESYNIILNIEDAYLSLNKISFITTLILLLRQVLIIIN